METMEEMSWKDLTPLMLPQTTIDAKTRAKGSLAFNLLPLDSSW